MISLATPAAAGSQMTKASGVQSPFAFQGGIYNPTAILININGGYYDPATMTPIRSPINPNCQMFTLDVTGDCGGGFGDVGSDGGGQNTSAGLVDDGPQYTVLPADVFFSIQDTPAWIDFKPATAALYSDVVKDPYWQEQLP